MGQGWAQPLGKGVWPNPASLHVGVWILGQDWGYLGSEVGYLGSEGGKGQPGAAHHCVFISSEMQEHPGRPLPKGCPPARSKVKVNPRLGARISCCSPQFLLGQFGNYGVKREERVLPFP